MGQNMTSYADDSTVLASTPKILEVEVKVNQIITILVGWRARKQLAFAPQ